MLKENIGIILALVSLVVIAFIRRVDGFSQPKIVQHSDNDVYLNYGMPLILFCTATGFPLPLITWYHKGQKQESGNKIVIEAINQTSTKVKSIFTISNVMYLSKSGNPSYRCEAENRNGSTGPIIIKVFVNGKPIAPIQYESIAINSTSILVSWKAVETSKSPILVYTLYYNTDQTKTPKVNISATQSTNYSLVVTGLEQLTTYLTYITASNSYGEGEASEKKISKTLAADPQPPKISLYNKKKITHHELTLKFVPSQQNKRDILAYQIFVEIIQDKPKSSPITLPAIYGNHSLNKSKGQLYMAADFKKQLPHIFTLGDGQWYGFHYNTRLLPLTKYRIYVRALARSTINEKKIIYGKAETLEVSTSFPEVPKIVLMKASTESLEISWHKSLSDMIYYKLLMKQGDNIVLDKRIDKVPYTLQGLEAGKVYTVYLTVCSKNHCTPSAKGTELKTIDIAKSPESSMQLLVIVIAVGIAVLLLIVVIAVVYFVRRRKRQKQGFQEKDKANGETVPQITKKGSTRSLDEDEIGLMENKDGMQLSNIELKPIRAKPTFADGESSTDAKTDWECSRGFVKVIKDIERDNFGKICKGSVKQFRDVSNASVMMRILKDNPSESTKADFLSVIETMKRLPIHNGVVNLLGCITKQDPLTMILEYVPYGDLLGYLRTSRGLHDEHYKSEKSLINDLNSDLNSAELMSFAEQIAAAMAHLEQYKVIHGDLSARNVLVDRKGLCKLTKFGENPLVFDKDTYATKRKGRLLIKWAAIEVLFNKIHTIESDVWSFGILLYEIATVGGCPYIGKDDKWLLDMLKDDYRLPCPEHVSEALYSVMLDCWKNEPNERPNFEKLVKVMRTLTLMNKHQDHINMTKYDGQLYSKLDDS